ncbi:hypothetical protein [Candidatus Methylacidithermus pantelleriae]|uniref:hypothetical protein n=1 Tax=Candidatus Methylacidithermus pantelleriae TaxID=2744239 RepID=UPI00157C5255|nr:hypothetical protein [Candidatus Methylacidithermus pantelleriae]
MEEWGYLPRLGHELHQWTRACLFSHRRTEDQADALEFSALWVADWELADLELAAEAS